MDASYFAESVHLSSCVWRSKLWRKTKIQKKAMLDARQVYPVNAFVLACVEIQRIWRGVLLRRRVLAKYLYKNFKRLKAIEDERTLAAYMALPPTAFATSGASGVGGSVSPTTATGAGVLTPQQQQMLLSCAQRTIARMRMVLKKAEFSRWMAYQKYTIYYIAATTISRQWLEYRFRKKNVASKNISKPFFLTREDLAAAKIQRRWRGHIGRQIFRFYADLIRMREHADARLMLRCINPVEASLIDAASSIHLRFRLGGLTFPPTIFYKLYVHGPVCDLGALAPRDYRTEKKINPVVLHSNNLGDIPTQLDRSNWYRRVDNNDWRPISDKELVGIESHVDKMLKARKPVITESDPFHWSRQVRREEREIRRKEKRRKWLFKLYTQTHPGEFRALADDNETDPEVALEEEVRKLVEWTDLLDFGDYQRSWQMLATSAYLPPVAVELPFEQLDPNNT